ncbi:MULTISPECIES: DUF4395 domain-containing protein [unclassified Microbacterium]|uniref:DUF4395 domain-containing protein n=1 Tax=unclassified Microbacterium TaxID=2609290 RepID=UPI00386C4E8D
MPERRGIDPRGPRFAAAVTSVLLLLATLLSLLGMSTAHTDASFGGLGPIGGGMFIVPVRGWVLPSVPLEMRVTDLGFLAVLLVALLFVWGVASPRTAPWGTFYRAVIRPRLAPPTDLEDPRPPRFAQGVGLVVTTVGLVLHLAGVPLALPIAAALAFMAAFLNAVFGLCLGCQLWVLLQRGGFVGRAG